jgi:hypothetical protein
VRILFSVRTPANVRQYDGVLRALAARGHQIVLAREPFGAPRWPPFVRALADDCPGITLETMPAITKSPWWELATDFRRARFYLRFFRPVYRRTPALLERARKRAPDWVVTVGDRTGALGRALLARVLDALEQSTRSSEQLHEYLDRVQPDIVVLTPLVVLKTTQLDLARAAMERGIRNIFAVASWDHLSSKGELNFRPQRVLVWNDVQKREAIELHHQPADRIIVTGSQVFDDWFNRRPATTREEFCRKVGLRADRPILLYLCSSLLESSPHEPPFIARWIRAIRESDREVLRQCGILIRPHHERREGWDDVDLSGFENVVCWPPIGEAPVDTASKSDYFDSMYHAAAVAGLNTSAMIEAGIVGRTVHTVLLPEFHDSQEGTLHFPYLLQGQDALLRASRSLDEHAGQLAGVLEGHDADPGRSERFVRAFVRPAGLDVPATTRVVDAIESLAQEPAPQPARVPAWTGFLRRILKPYADAAAERMRIAAEEARARSEQRLREHRAAKEPQILEHRRRRMEQHRRRKQGNPVT